LVSLWLRGYSRLTHKEIPHWVVLGRFSTF
jgi:hypothetical protein